MDIQVNNSRTTPGPESTGGPSVTVHPVKDRSTNNAMVPELITPGHSSERNRASHLAAINPSSRTKEIKEPTKQTQGLNIIESMWNWIKKGGKNLCLIGGWGSATAAVVSVLFFNITTLGVLFGIPAALFLYTAASLGKDIKSDPISVMMKDPLSNLKNILEKHPELLRTDPKLIISTIQSAANIKKNDPQYSEVMDRLGALQDCVQLEIAQLRNREDEQNYEQSIVYLERMEAYLHEIARSDSRSTTLAL